MEIYKTSEKFLDWVASYRMGDKFYKIVPKLALKMVVSPYFF